MLLIAMLALLASLQNRTALFSLRVGLHTDAPAQDDDTQEFKDSLRATTFSDNHRERVLVTDLDSDGYNELLSVRPDGSLRLYNRVYSSAFEDAEAPLTVKKSASIRTVKAVDASDTLGVLRAMEADLHPAALSAGFIDPFVDGDNTRRQVIAVLRKDLTLMCFDHDLKLKWEVSLKEHLHLAEHHHISSRDATILISPTPIHKGDRGAVIVGVRVFLQDTSDRVAYMNANLDASKDGDGAAALTEEEKEAESMERQHRQANEDAKALHHFSYVALSGVDGSIRWKHDTDSLEEEANEEESTVPQQNYRIDLASFQRSKNRGEVPWKTYSDSVLGSLPHRWRTPEDTKLVLAHFTRQKSKVQDRVDETDHGENLLNAVTDKLMALTQVAQQPHNSQDMVVKPNVVVAHLQQGVEVLHYYSGRTLTQVALSPGATYADVNGDMKIDRVHMTESSDQRLYSDSQQIARCVAKVESGLPSLQTILAKDLCVFAKSGGATTVWSVQHDRESAESGSVDSTDEESSSSTVDPDASLSQNNIHFGNIDAACPLVKPRSGSLQGDVTARSFHRHTSSGVSPTEFVQAGQDLVYALSNGMVFSYDGLKGSTRWFTQTKVEWDATNPRSPAVELFSSHVLGQPDMVLVVGESRVALLSAETGEIQVERELAHLIIGLVQKGDFNNDGWTDLLIPTTNGYTGFGLFKEDSVPLLTTLVAGLLLCVVGLYVAHRVSAQSHEEDLPLMGSAKSNQPFKRATD